MDTTMVLQRRRSITMRTFNWIDECVARSPSSSPGEDESRYSDYLAGYPWAGIDGISGGVVGNKLSNRGTWLKSILDWQNVHIMGCN